MEFIKKTLACLFIQSILFIILWYAYFKEALAIEGSQNTDENRIRVYTPKEIEFLKALEKKQLINYTDDDFEETKKVYEEALLDELYQDYQKHEEEIEEKNFEIQELKDLEQRNEAMEIQLKKVYNLIQSSNLFSRMRVYNMKSELKFIYRMLREKLQENVNIILYQVKKENYCNLADYHNLVQRNHLAKNSMIIHDYQTEDWIKQKILTKIAGGEQELIEQSNNKLNNSSTNVLDIHANMLFLRRKDFHFYYLPNRNFMCISQSYNHIPGSEPLQYLMDIFFDLREYEQEKPCYNASSYILQQYDLNEPNSCQLFFENYSNSIQYMITNSSNIQRYQLNDDEFEKLQVTYENGGKCNNTEGILVEQLLPSLLILKNQEIPLISVFALVSSTNPLITWYHEGPILLIPSFITKSFLKNQFFEGFTSQNSITEVIELFQQAIKINETQGFKSITQNNLSQILYDQNITQSSTTIQSEIVPKMQKIMYQVLKSMEKKLFKHSSIFELFQFNFMLDEQMKPWLVSTEMFYNDFYTNYTQTQEILESIFEGMFTIQFKMLRNRWAKIQKFLKGSHRFTTKKFQHKFKKINTNALPSSKFMNKLTNFELLIGNTSKIDEYKVVNISDIC